MVKPVSESSLPQSTSHNHLRLRILRPDCRHINVSLLWSEVIHTAKIRISEGTAKEIHLFFPKRVRCTILDKLLAHHVAMQAGTLMNFGHLDLLQQAGASACASIRFCLRKHSPPLAQVNSSSSGTFFCYQGSSAPGLLVGEFDKLWEMFGCFAKSAYLCCLYLLWSECR